MVYDLHHLPRGDCAFVSGLCRRHQIESGMSLITNQCLLDAAVTFYHIHQIIYDTVLQSHDNIEIAQSDIRIDEADFTARLGKTCSDICRCSGLTYTAFS